MALQDIGMRYEYVDDISLADVCFIAEGRTLEELLIGCGLATTNVMVKDLKSVELKKKIDFAIETDSAEKLIAKFIDELIFYKDAEQLLLADFKLKLEEKDGKYLLKCTARGDKLDMEKHDLVVDVKAFTWHMFEVKHDKKGWGARVVLDI